MKSSFLLVAVHFSSRWFQLTPNAGASTDERVREGNFELLVIGAREAVEEDVVYLDHAQIYCLTIISRSDAPHEVILKIDGKEMGVYNLPPYHTIHIHGSKRGLFRFLHQEPDDYPTSGEMFTDTAGWIMALFVHVPTQADGSFNQQQMPFLPQATIHEPLLSDHADISQYNLDTSVCLEVLMECEPTLPTPGVATHLPRADKDCTRDAIQIALREFDYTKAIEILLVLFDRQAEASRQERDERLASFTEKPDTSPPEATPTSPPPSVNRDEPEVSAEQLIRYRRRFRKAMQDYLARAAGLTLEELEIALAKLADKACDAADPMKKGGVELRHRMLTFYHQARKDRRKRRHLSELVWAWLRCPHYKTTLGDEIINNLVEFPLPKPPGSFAVLPSEEELRRMIDLS